MEITVGQLRRLYLAVCDRELGNNSTSLLARVVIIQLLENAVKKPFEGTRDFHSKVGEFFIRNSDSNAIVHVPTFCEKKCSEEAVRAKYRQVLSKNKKALKETLPLNN